MTMRVLVVEDEDVARRYLVRLLGAHEDVEIIGQPVDGIEALEMIEKTSPDAVFLDIEMPGLQGFEVLERLSVKPLIVFTTAHSEYALPAFKENAVDYLLKPIAPEDLQRAVEKLRLLAAPPTASERVVEKVLKRLGASDPPPRQFLLSLKDELKPVQFDQIVYLESRDKCTIVRTLDGEHEAQAALSELEARLPPADFIRIHRRHIVNCRYIAALQRWGNRQLKVELTVPIQAELYVSRRAHDDVLRRMGSLV